MDVTRWEPFGGLVNLRDAMDRLMSESFLRPFGEGSRQPGSLAVDISEEGDKFVVSAPVPGMKPDDVEITVLGDTLRIRGERREERKQEGEGQRWLVREQRFGAFERMIRLPSIVKAEAAEADFKDGILTIKLPKSEEGKERRIQIRGTDQADTPIEAESKTAGRGGTAAEG